MNEVNRKREEFVNICKANITREGIDDLLNWLDTTDFYTAPASTHYHGSYAGGLIDHSLNVYYSMLDELTFIYGSDKWKTIYSLETATIVSLFHDLCKINRYTPGIKNVKNPDTNKWEQVPTFYINNEAIDMGHAPLSIFYINQFMHLTEQETQAIYWHMGAFDISNYNTTTNLCNAYKKNTLAFALNRADGLSTFIVENEYFEPLPYDSE